MNSQDSEHRGERGLIRQFRRALEGIEPTPAVPFGDDMAALAADGSLLWSIDTLMDGVDFRSGEHAWRAIGRKAAAVNLSDCAAMASRPTAMLCSVVLSETLSRDDAIELFEGVREIADEFECPLSGGDTNSWPHPTVISVVVASRMPTGRKPVLRCGARAGDGIFVTGRLGGSILGRHMRFTPRVELALRIADEVRPHAMIDISDGLAVDLWHICEESSCGAVLKTDSLSAAIHPDAETLSATTGKPPLEHALSDGEDFELIVALPPDAPTDAVDALKLLRIGTITAAGGVMLVGPDGNAEPLPPRGWEHFQ